MRIAYRRSSWAFGALIATISSSAAAQTALSDAPADPTGAPPADEKALVAAPKDGMTAPTPVAPTDATTATVSAGGQWATGNSQLLAGTMTGAFEKRKGANGFAAGLIGNYGQGAPGGKDSVLTSENFQARIRYDRYLIEKLSVFGIATGRYDRFQGLDFRLNLDPGVKYLFIADAKTTLWGEAGYDFQYDIRRNADRGVVDSTGALVIDPVTGQPELVDKTHADHSARLFAGFKHAFNKEVTLATGLEYLQSVVDSTRYRINYDALIAANVGAGFSFGFAFSARYDHDPLSGKKDLDTVTTANLIFAFSDAPEPVKPDLCPCLPLDKKPAETAPSTPAEAPPPSPMPAPLPAPSDATPPVQTMVPPASTVAPPPNGSSPPPPQTSPNP